MSKSMHVKEIQLRTGGRRRYAVTTKDPLEQANSEYSDSECHHSGQSWWVGFWSRSMTSGIFCELFGKGAIHGSHVGTGPTAEDALIDACSTVRCGFITPPESLMRAARDLDETLNPSPVQ